ncbi:MAG: ATP-binding cassette domain-containing protein [Acidimicrobiia bacterium]
MSARERIVAVDGLWKTFGAVGAVEDFSFSVERGQVCGLLGPNGAGKTTTLRVLMGLERPSRGKATLFGTEVGPGCRELARVGAMVEQAEFVPHLSGMRNLRLWWEAGGGRIEDADLDDALAIAGLGDALDRKVKTYSQGMRQRLGFARLLLARPELLVLDEPTNGLDPGEIREIRELIGRLTAQGATVLLSSHHLSEVEQTCSHVVVMDHGRLVANGTVSELIGTSGSVYVEVDDRERARAVLTALPSVTAVANQGDGLVVALADGRRSDLSATLVAAGLRLETITATQRLEDAFLGLLDAGAKGTTP